MRKLQVLLKLREDASLADLAAALEQELGALRSDLREGIDAGGTVGLEDDPTPKTVLGQTVTGSVRNRWHGMIEAHSETASHEELSQLLAGPAKRLGKVADLSRSAAVAGEVHLIVPGEDALIFLYPLRRRTEFTHESFSQYWIDVHSEHGRVAPGLHGYRQLHGDLVATKDACKRLGLGVDDLDGIAESQNSDIDNFMEVMSSSVTAGAGSDDTSVFIDQERSAVFLTRVLTPAH